MSQGSCNRLGVALWFDLGYSDPEPTARKDALVLSPP